MKRLCYILCCCFASMVTLHAQPLLTIQEKALSGGGHLYFVQSKQLPMLDVKVLFHAGSSYDHSAWGLANLTNALLEEGSENKSANDIADALASHGAQLSFSVNRLSASLSLRVLKDSHYSVGALNTLHSILVQPSFPQESVNRVKNQVLVGIDLRQQKPSALAQDAFYHQLYGALPYAHPVKGVASTVSKISKKNIESFYHQYYVRNNASVIIVGDCSWAFAQKVAQRLLSGMSQGKPPLSLPQASFNRSAANEHIHFPSTQTTYWLGQIGISRNNPDYFGLLLGNEILGGNQERARLFEVLRNQNGLVYGIYSVLNPAPFKGPYFVAFQTANKSASEALALVLQQIKLFVSHGVSSKELAVTKKKMIGSFYLNFSSNMQLLNAASIIAFYHLPLSYWDDYLQKIKQVNKADVGRAFSSIIYPDKWRIVSVGASLPNNK